MKMYKTGGWKMLIEEVEIERVTEASVWVESKSKYDSGRQGRKTNYQSFWDTKEEAKEYLKDKLESSLLNAKETLSRIENKLKELNKIEL